MAEFALPTKSQSSKWKKTHKRGPAFPMGTKRQAGSARGFAVMMANKGQLTKGELQTIVRRTTKAGLKPATITGKKGSYRLSAATRKKATPMAKRTKKRTVRRTKRGTRKGQRRKTARRAFVGTKQSRRAATRRRSARRNPTGILRTPGARYGIAAVAGAAAATLLANDAAKGGVSSRLQFQLGGMTVPVGVTGAVLTILGSKFLVKRAATRQWLTAAAAGMLAPVAMGQVARLASGGTPTLLSSSQAMVRRKTRPVFTNPNFHRDTFEGATWSTGPADTYNSAMHFAGDLIHS